MAKLDDGRFYMSGKVSTQFGYT